MKTDSSTGTVPSRLIRTTEECVDSASGTGTVSASEIFAAPFDPLTETPPAFGISPRIDRALQAARVGVISTLDDELCTFRYVSDSLCFLLGYTRDEFLEMSGSTAAGAIYPPDLPAAFAECRKCFAQGVDYHTEYRMRQKDGTLLWVTDSGYRVVDRSGESFIYSVITDISEDKETLESLRIERKRYETVAELSDDVVCEYDVHRDALKVFSSKLEPLNGLPHRKGVFNYFLRDRVLAGELVAPEDRDRFVEDLNQIIVAPQDSGDFYALEYRLRLRSNRPKGLFITDEYTPCRVLLRRIFDSEGKTVKLVGKIVDISHEFVLRHQSATDSLTGAYNRSYLCKEIEDYGRRKASDLSFAVLLFDVDFFKRVNDSLGHLAGDKMLIELVNIARLLFRRTDVIARLGGDEFIIFMRDIYDARIVKEKTDMLLIRFKELAEEEGYPDEVSLSGGIVITDESDVTFPELYERADIALYTAKARGKNRSVFYEPSMTHPATVGSDGSSCPL
ncbi:MAG: diguanylate cyclase [Raoultibacter sp.]